MDRPLPDLRSRLRANSEQAAGEGGLEALWALDLLDSPGAAIAVAVGTLLLFVVLLPLIGVAVELIALAVLLWSGIVGRVVLQRPWIIEATNIDNPSKRVAFAVKGWRRSSGAIEEIADAIAAVGPPESVSGAIPLGSTGSARR